MTTYAEIFLTAIDQDSSITQPLMVAMRDNPIAIAEGDSGAPAMATGWLNYDGATTLTAIYDSAVHGTVASITTPAFADGWEYMLIFQALTNDSGGSTADVGIQLYKDAISAYGPLGQLWSDQNSLGLHGFVIIEAPRRVATYTVGWRCLIDATGSSTGFDPITDAVFTNEQSALMAFNLTATSVRDAKLTVSGASFNGGKIFMARRQSRGVF